MPHIQPTIGRRIWYWPSLNDRAAGLCQLDSKLPCDAGVVFVHDANTVNLLVTDHVGQQFVRASVCIVGAEQPYLGNFGHAQWMPYQAAQAAKHAEAK
jgi:hypothetical protein